MDIGGIVVGLNTKEIIKNLKKLEDLFDNSNLNENHEIFSKKNEKVTGIFKLETPKSIWIDEFVALRSKTYVFKCGDDI